MHAFWHWRFARLVPVEFGKAMIIWNGWSKCPKERHKGAALCNAISCELHFWWFSHFFDYLATWKSDYVLHNEVDDIFQRVLCILSVFLLVKKVAMFTFPFEDWYWDVCSMLEQLLGFFWFFLGNKAVGSWKSGSQHNSLSQPARGSIFTILRVDVRNLREIPVPQKHILKRKPC